MTTDGDGLFPGPCLNPGDSIVQGRMYDGGPYYPRQVVPRGGQPSVFAEPLTDEQLKQIRAAFLSKLGQPPKLLTPLPRRVRLRLAVRRAADHAAIWLADHHLSGMAGLLWSMSGRWR